jgi:hypothetical protein
MSFSRSHNIHAPFCPQTPFTRSIICPCQGEIVDGVNCQRIRMHALYPPLLLWKVEQELNLSLLFFLALLIHNRKREMGSAHVQVAHPWKQCSCVLAPQAQILTYPSAKSKQIICVLIGTFCCCCCCRYHVLAWQPAGSSDPAAVHLPTALQPGCNQG